MVVKERKEVYSVMEILEKVSLEDIDRKDRDQHKIDFDGDLVFMASRRYQVFKAKGTRCVHCNRQGMFFAKERHASRQEFHGGGYHFNLYGFDDETEVLMTKNRIVLGKDGGLDELDNYQVTCDLCNQEKVIVLNG
jgi:hypothetical protein